MMKERQLGVMALLVALGSWTLSSPLVKFLVQNGYDPHTQNFYRYAAGTLLVMPFLWMRLRQRSQKLSWSLVRRCTVPAMPNIVHQATWVSAMWWIYPTFAAFLTKSSVLFAAGMVFWLFPEERWLFRSARFVSGLLLCLAGTAGLALLRSDLGSAEVNLGVILVLTAAAAWAVYSVSVKRLSHEVGSTVSFGIVGVHTTAGLFAIALVWGDLGYWREATWQVNAVLVGSGMLCIGLAQTMYYVALRTLGVAVCATMLLTTPLGTMVVSWFWFGESLTTGQLVSGLMLLAGGALTLLAKEKTPELRMVKATETASG
jgi:drug/metabolite transporter (DMT)-like permease